jgi:DNA-binding NtrC family response regulator
LHQDTQAKLLRVLQEREVSRLGGRQPIPVDVRVVAATNRDLERAVKEGLFREDLYWRLSGFSVCMPPLRDRRDDVPLLIDHFLDRLNVKLGLKVNGVSPDARIRLMAHDWPGNVRELESVLQRAMIMMDGSTIQAADLPINVGRRPGTSSPPTDGEPVLPGTMEEVVARAKARVEDALIEATMAQFGGNQTRTAEALGIGRRTLYNKLKRSSWALRPEDKSDDD